jgi:hypothetical protein
MRGAYGSLGGINLQNNYILACVGVSRYLAEGELLVIKADTNRFVPSSSESETDSHETIILSLSCRTDQAPAEPTGTLRVS